MRSYKNEETVAAFRFAALSGDSVINAASSADNIIGITASTPSAEDEMTDVYTIGELADIEAGGTISAGDALTSDSSGRAISASNGDNIGAIAEQDAVEGDIIRAFVVIQRSLTASADEEETTEE